MFTLHQQTPKNSLTGEKMDVSYIYKHVQLGWNKLTISNQRQTGVTHWSNKLQQTSLLLFFCVVWIGLYRWTQDSHA